MAAGLGFKDFQTGEVLTAADVDGYLMQNIWVFASNAARDAAVTSPSEGNFAFTKDTNSLWYYDGAAWVASGATGDIEGVTAGIGISGGGTSGTVTVTNSMATAIDAKGDLVAGTGADTFAKLTVGANNTVLTADSAEATGLKWVAPSAGASFVGCKAKKTAVQSIANATVTKITFDSEYFDTDSIHDNSTNNTRFTVPSGKNGKWQVIVMLHYNIDSSGFRQIRLMKNNSVFGVSAINATVSANTSWAVSDIFDLVATDYMEVAAYQTSGASINTGDGDQVTFAFYFLGA
jgi:hypothetical protein